MNKSEIHQIIRDAINAKKVARIKYDNDLRDREILPHAIFVTKRAGHDFDVSAWQRINENKPNDVESWKTFDVNKIREAKVLDETFQRRPDFDPSAPLYGGGIICMFT